MSCSPCRRWIELGANWPEAPAASPSVSPALSTAATWRRSPATPSAHTAPAAARTALVRPKALTREPRQKLIVLRYMKGVQDKLCRVQSELCRQPSAISRVADTAALSVLHAWQCCAACGRLSYTFGLRGPAVSVDTACSSSLVATHLALHYVATGASSAGLVAGIGLMFIPAPSAMFRKVGCWTQ